MPAVSRAKLTSFLIEAFDSSGSSAILLSSRTTNPRSLQIHYAERQLRIYAYLWTLTHGGRPSLPDEYRIQLTGVQSPLKQYSDGLTILLGYEPSLKMFAGFDVSRHYRFTPGSPSVQININSVREAITTGLSFDRKSNEEIACGIRPDFMVTYVSNAPKIHKYGSKTKDLELLKKAVVGDQLPVSKMKELTKPRRRNIVEVGSWSREAGFRRLVLQAYDNRCSVTGIQLKLVDAAHILPVGAPDSTDEVTNGICLSPTYHRAFDRGLIFLDTDYCFKLNESKVNELSELNLTSGLNEFAKPLGKIILPSNQNLRPSLRYIRKGNEFRSIG